MFSGWRYVSSCHSCSRLLSLIASSAVRSSIWSLTPELLTVLRSFGFSSNLGHPEEAVAVHDGQDDAPMLSAVFSLLSAVLDTLPWMLSAQYLDQTLKLAAQAMPTFSTIMKSPPQGFCSWRLKRLEGLDCCQLSRWHRRTSLSQANEA